MSKKDAMQIFSPATLCGLSLLVVLVSWIIPQRVYAAYLYEKPNFTLDFLAISWVIFCSVSYLIGIALYKRLRIHIPLDDKYLSRRNMGRLNSVIILSAAAYLFLLMKSLGGLSGYWYVVKAFGSDENRLLVYNMLERLNIGWVPQLIFPFVCYTTYLFFAGNGLRRLYNILPLTLYILSILPSQTKASILSILVMLVFVYCYHLMEIKRLSPSRVIYYLVSLLLVSLGFFVFAQSGKQGRDFSSSSGIITEVMGYVPASYNRLSSVINKRLKMPNSDMGYYTNTWYWDSPIKNVLAKPLEKLQFDIPQNGFDNWLESFRAVRGAGLNDNYIWVTVYGEAFLDYGRWAIVWFFAYGFAAQAVWEIALKRERYIVLYSVFLISGFQWYATASIGNKGTIFAILAVVALSFKRTSWRRTALRRS